MIASAEGGLQGRGHDRDRGRGQGAGQDPGQKRGNQGKHSKLVFNNLKSFSSMWFQVYVPARTNPSFIHWRCKTLITMINKATSYQRVRYIKFYSTFLFKNM